MGRHFSLCALSRLIGYALTGRHVMLCTLAHERSWPLRHVLDALCYYRDGPDHCVRMAMDDERLDALPEPKRRFVVKARLVQRGRRQMLPE